MNEKYSSVKDKKISKNRKERVMENIRKGFEKNRIGRELVKVKEIKSEEIKNYTNKEFFKIGLASIIDKIFFVDEPGGETYYSYRGLGYDYGVSVAEGETKGIIKRIIEKVKPENKFKVIGEKIKIEDITNGVKKLFSYSNIDRFEGNVILTNIPDEFDFWYMDGFEPFKDGKDKEFSYFNSYGFLKVSGRRIPVFYSRLVPKGVTLLLNKNKIGTLLIKKPLQISIEDAGKLLEERKGKIIKDIPSLTKEELNEKVEIIVYEIIRFEIENLDAVVMFEREIKEE